jgi:putative OPT family oligopeptide transporter
MPLFQKPPTTDDELEQNKPLAIPPEAVGQMDEREWYERAFRGHDAVQLTRRSVVTGCVLGFFLAFTNVYVGLKTGWLLGVALTACITSFTVWSALLRLGVVRTPMTILENNCMQSTASSAGAATTALLVSAVPAMLLLSVTDTNPLGTNMRWYLVLPWVLAVGALGVLMAIPMKRSMINRERLKFPSGTAAAVLLQSLYSEGAEALAKGRALLWSGAVGVLVPLLTELNAVKTINAAGRAERGSILPSQVKVFDWLPRIAGYPVSAWNVSLDMSLVLVGAGAIVGLRTTLSMLAGGLMLVLFIGPVALVADWTNASGHLVTAVTRPGAAWKEIGIWFGAPLMVAYGLVTFALGFRTIGRAFSNLRGAAEVAEDDPAREIEVPIAWFVVGTAVTGVLVVLLAWFAFDVPLHYGALAVFLTFFLALVACRATGDTDITPIGAMGKIMQLTYGALIPQNYAANLMTASITAGASSEAADLLNDLKSGYLLGAHPRRQFVAQFLGIFTGAVASVLCYFLVVPDATVLTGRAGSPPQFAAPSAQQWRAVAELFRTGIGNLHPLAREGIAIGLLAGTVLAVVEWLFPKGRRWLPSATGVGLGMLLPFATSLSFVLGAGLAWAFARVDKRRADRFVIPISSGVIAGESIVGVVVAALNNFALK